MKLKQLDKMILKGFFPPFVMTFFIALFVLVMQFLWKYVDDIIGKGLEVHIILELLFYLSMSLVPLALPIAVLISSVMVMGNMGERYELASLKSAGVSLARVMTSLIVLAVVAMFLSYYTADKVIPYSNLKFQSRLYDIRRQKPTLSLEEGIFNDDFKGYSIRVEKKEANEVLKGVSIYDHSRNQGNVSQILAKKGEMRSTDDQRFMVMQLNDGTQYQELQTLGSSDQQFPFVRVHFKEWRKVFDMKQFDLDRTDENLFKNHQRMLNTDQLLTRIDSFNMQQDEACRLLYRKAIPFFSCLQAQDSSVIVQPMRRELLPPDDTVITDFTALVPPAERPATVSKAVVIANRVKDYALASLRTLERTDYSKVEHYNELHRKLIFAFACLIFVFIGAPMGAIIRKGGFGWPLLVSIIFFVLFVVFALIGERLSQGLYLTPFWGMWLPCLLMIPIGLILTKRAMEDSSSMNLETYTQFFVKVFNRFKKPSKP